MTDTPIPNDDDLIVLLNPHAGLRGDLKDVLRYRQVASRWSQVALVAAVIALKAENERLKCQQKPKP